MTESSHQTRLPGDAYESAAAARVLAGAGSYDSLTEQEQAVVREKWAERMATRRATLDYAAQFSTAGESCSEIDEDGHLVIHPAG